ncbi:MAG: DUF4352 domain-containing protein [Eggerthellaceae bacterium]|nr:DUF4352 domain-containing protein [Eggerthellaceae bacterium]
MSAEVIGEKPSKDGYDESSNSVVSVAGVGFQIPAYFGERDEKDTYYAEKGAAVSMLQLSEYSGVAASNEEFEKSKASLAESLVEGVGKSADEIGEPTVEDASVAGLPAATCIFDFKTKGVNATSKVVFFYNSESQAVGILHMCQSGGTQYDYFPDFDKIIASAAKSEAKSTAPTLGSTIEFGNLSIEFGSELQTTAINNQFSDHNGETVLYVPVKVTNNGSESSSLNMYAVKAFGSKGTELDMIFTYFDDDARMAGDMRPGASQEANLYFLYDGDGTYYLDFGFYKTEVEVEIPVKLQ